MATDRRVRKKIEEAKRLRLLSPRETIEIGTDLAGFGAELAEAARHAKHQGRRAGI